MNAFVEMNKSTEDTNYAGSWSEYRPIAWYQNNGYNEEQCKNIDRMVPLGGEIGLAREN